MYKFSSKLDHVTGDERISLLHTAAKRGPRFDNENVVPREAVPLVKTARALQPSSPSTDDDNARHRIGLRRGSKVSTL